MASTYKYIGQRMKRVEDPRLLTGKGTYAEDVTLPGLAHAAVLRSPHAHARIKSIRTDRARAVPGVLAVVTGADARELTGPLPCFHQNTVTQYCLAVDKVRHVGEPVAAVVAVNRYVAEDACELIEVEYEPLPPVVRPEQALAAGAPLLHEELGTNVAWQRKYAFGDVDGLFRRAALVVRDRFYWGRSAGMPIETAGATASWDQGSGSMTIWSNSNFGNLVGWLLALSLKISTHKLNLVPTLAGGSFGAKLFLPRVQVLAGLLSKVTGRPVRYMEDRLDHNQASDNHGPERIYDAELALAADGTMLALRCKVLDDYGAYIQFGCSTNANALGCFTGPYKMQACELDLTAVLTNKNQQGAYRGFGSEPHYYVLEMLADRAARQLGLTPEALRQRNLIQPHEFPYKTPTGNTYDSGNYPQALQTVLETVGIADFRREQAEARKQGRYLGIGLVQGQMRGVFSATEFWLWQDKPAFPLTSLPESVSMKVDPLGNVSIMLHSPFWGNSPETMAVQFVAEELGIDPAAVSVTYGDTQNGLPAAGPGGSRMAAMAAGAVQGATAKIKEKAKRIAAHLLECHVEDLEWKDGKAAVKGAPDKVKSLADIAMLANHFVTALPPGEQSGLEATYTYDHPATTLPNADRTDLGNFYPIVGHAVHAPIVEVDAETGQVKFLKYVALHDIGTQVNPMTVEGQVVGGIIQGIGTALYEEFRYDQETGQLQNSTFMEYLLPLASDMPDIQVLSQETPSPFTPYGIKGAGEGGRMLAPAAVAAAIEDALAPFGVKVSELPMTPDRIRQLIRQARR